MSEDGISQPGSIGSSALRIAAAGFLALCLALALLYGLLSLMRAGGAREGAAPARVSENEKSRMLAALGSSDAPAYEIREETLESLGKSPASVDHDLKLRMLQLLSQQ